MAPIFLKKLKELYPTDFSAPGFFPYALFSGIFVFLFFFLLQPFGLGFLPPSQSNPLYAGYALITTAMVVINHLTVPRLLRRSCCEECWSVGKEILFSSWITLTIAVACFFFTRGYMHRHALPLAHATFGVVLLGTCIIGSLIISIFILVNQNRVLRRNQTIEGEANARLDTHPGPDAAVPELPVVLVAENGKDTFSSKLDEILCIVAEENYVEIFYKREKVQRLLLRSSLLRIERQVQRHRPQLFRCHRAYIVNTKKIKKVSGNAQGLKLTVQDVPFPVPVARRYVDKFRRDVVSRF